MNPLGVELFSHVPHSRDASPQLRDAQRPQSPDAGRGADAGWKGGQGDFDSGFWMFYF